MPAFFFDCFALEDGTDRLSQNVFKQPLPTYAAKHTRRPKASTKPLRKPEIPPKYITLTNLDVGLFVFYLSTIILYFPPLPLLYSILFFQLS